VPRTSAISDEFTGGKAPLLKKEEAAGVGGKEPSPLKRKGGSAHRIKKRKKSLGNKKQTKPERVARKKASPPREQRRKDTGAAEKREYLVPLHR